MEFPIACFSGIRLPLVLSYAKLFGLAALQATTRLLSLPKAVAVYFHPYDLYVAEIADNIPGWKRYAHLRNSRDGLRILDGLIGMLKERGYQFMLMESAAKNLMISNLPVLLSLDAKHYR